MTLEGNLTSFRFLWIKGERFNMYMFIQNTIIMKMSMMRTMNKHIHVWRVVGSFDWSNLDNFFSTPDSWSCALSISTPTFLMTLSYVFSSASISYPWYFNVSAIFPISSSCSSWSSISSLCLCSCLFSIFPSANYINLNYLFNSISIIFYQSNIHHL